MTAVAVWGIVGALAAAAGVNAVLLLALGLLRRI